MLHEVRTGSGLMLLKKICPSVESASILARIDRRYQDIDDIRVTHGPAEVARRLEPGARFASTASSLNLRAVFGKEEEPVIQVILRDRRLRPLLMRALGGCLAIDLDQAWVRRQYAVPRYPPLHAPHGWHQDGALGFDFLAPCNTRSKRCDLLNMITCWIALTACGRDAPGLELIAGSPNALLPVRSLSDSAIRDRHPAHAFWHPLLDPGDAVLFSGEVIHRTHVTPSMEMDRTSLELRFFRADSIPHRLRSDRFMHLD